MLIFTARSDVNGTIERFIRSAEVETKTPDYAASLRKCYVSTINSTEFLAWSTNQAFIALGLAVGAAAEMEIGHCPMSGFDPPGVHRVLGLPENEHPVAYLAIGSDLDVDSDPLRVKCRLNIEDLAQWHR